MKKVFQKSISVFLALLMSLAVIPVIGFAIDEETKPAAPEFSVNLISETTAELKLGISVTEGSFLSFDCTLTVNGLECTSVYTADAYDAFGKEVQKQSGVMVPCGNAETSKFSTSTTISCEAPMDIVIFEFAKTTATGINGSDIKLTFESCYVDNGGVEADVTEAATVEITVPATHTHTKGATWTTTVEPTCYRQGTEVCYCTACGEIADSRPIDKTDVHEHTRVSESSAPTCGKDGYEKIYCDDCKQVVKTNTLPATGKHTEKTERVEPTCTNDGYEKVYCEVCKKEISYKKLDKTGHKWTSWSTVLAPTYRSVGIERRYCSDPECGAFEDREIPMLSTEVTGIKMSLKSISMRFKQSAQLYADVMPEEAVFTSKVVWTSSNPKVVEVNEDGVITAKGNGTVTITAATEDGKFSDTCTVTSQITWWQWVIIIVLFGWLWYI